MDGGRISRPSSEGNRIKVTFHSFSPWPWFITGPVIAIVMVLLLLIGRRFGLSSNLRTLCTITGADKWSTYFQFDWKAQAWNLMFVGGTITGGAIAGFLLLQPGPVALNPTTVETLTDLGIGDAGLSYTPSALFGATAWQNPMALGMLLVGGFLVGFGTRWANGCTSGHAISGLSSLQWVSLIAVGGFFVGGLLVTHLVLPLLLPLI